MYSVATTILLISSTQKFIPETIDEGRYVANYAFGEDWRQIKVKDLMNAWNVKHPGCLVSPEDNVNDIGHKMVKELKSLGVNL